MATQMYINLPVKDLNKSLAFFEKLGFKTNAQFSDDKAACLIIGTDCFIMLVSESFFKTFIKKEISDAGKSAEVILSVSRDTKAKVDEMVKIALAAGGKPSSAAKDYGWMYQQGFQDLDGHLWEVLFMDMSKLPTRVPQEKHSRDIL
jgi:hypothetical protein